MTNPSDVDVNDVLTRIADIRNGSASPDMATLEKAELAIKALIAERDEADRRAGAAERQREYSQESNNARANWLHRAKRQWGVDDNVSFDVVWAEALRLKAISEAP